MAEGSWSSTAAAAWSGSTETKRRAGDSLLHEFRAAVEDYITKCRAAEAAALIAATELEGLRREVRRRL